MPDAGPPGGYAPPGKRARLRRAAHQRGPARTAAACAKWLAGYAAGLPRTLAPGPEFLFDGERYRCLVHLHRWTWLSERAVEVPIAARHVERAAGGRILEVGHVLGHYGIRGHEVVDRWERAPGVRNADVMDLRGTGPYDLIVSISTLEHVGWDEAPRDPDRATAAMRLLAGELRPGGHLLATIPTGYHGRLEATLASCAPPLVHVGALRRTGRGPAWKQIEPTEALTVPYDDLLFRADAVLVAEAEALVRRS